MHDLYLVRDISTVTHLFILHGFLLSIGLGKETFVH